MRLPVVFFSLVVISSRLSEFGQCAENHALYETIICCKVEMIFEKSLLHVFCRDHRYVNCIAARRDSQIWLFKCNKDIALALSGCGS